MVESILPFPSESISLVGQRNCVFHHTGGEGTSMGMVFGMASQRSLPQCPLLKESLTPPPKGQLCPAWLAPTLTWDSLREPNNPGSREALL